MPTSSRTLPLNQPLSDHSEAGQLDFVFGQNLKQQPNLAGVAVYENAAGYAVPAAMKQSPVECHISSSSQQTDAQSGPATKLDELISEHVWRSSDLLKRRYVSLDTGFEQLNDQLASGGWPLGATTEIGISEAGIGELRLLLPAMAQAMNKAGGHLHSVWVAPPHQPFSPALAKYGIDLERITIVRAKTIDDILWAAEQALLSEACASVITWIGRHNISQRAIRRLQLAAEKSNSWHVLFRHQERLAQSSTSSLRLELSNDHYSRLRVHIIKQPQGWGGQECVLSLPPHYERWQRLPAQSLPHSNRYSTPLPRQVRILAKAVQGANRCNVTVDSVTRNNVISLKQVS